MSGEVLCIRYCLRCDSVDAVTIPAWGGKRLCGPRPDLRRRDGRWTTNTREVLVMDYLVHRRRLFPLIVLSYGDIRRPIPDTARACRDAGRRFRDSEPLRYAEMLHPENPPG
jgi:hypothetical protein